MRAMYSPAFWCIWLSVGAAILLSGCAGGEVRTVSIDDVLANPEEFVGERIRIEDAWVAGDTNQQDTSFYFGTTRRDCLTDDGTLDAPRCLLDDMIGVFGSGDIDLEGGDRVTVEGEFSIRTSSDGVQTFNIENAAVVDVN